MTTFTITRKYLLAREKILSREISDAVLCAQDGRASSHTQQQWRDIQALAKAELALVRQALAEVPPA
jgi:hypothetical protein